MPKRSIRSRLLAQRKAVSAADCRAKSDQIQQVFLDSGCLRDATCVALYSTIHNEVYTDKVAGYLLSAGKRLVYPCVRGAELEFLEVTGPDELSPGAFGVLEPLGDKYVPVDELDVIVVPGIAFDEAGHRLGYGKGYYDRALSACREGCKKVGFAYDMQLIRELPAFEHDQTLSLLVTESRTLVFQPSDVPHMLNCQQ